jgi:hypothetical protein
MWLKHKIRAEMDRLTIMTLTLFRIAHTTIKTPALTTSVAANFLRVRKLDFHSIGIGSRSMQTSVVTFKMNDTQRIGFETAAWQALPGFGLICQ